MPEILMKEVEWWCENLYLLPLIGRFGQRWRIEFQPGLNPCVSSRTWTDVVPRW